MNKFVRCYEDFTDDSAFEHVNPSIIKRVFVDREEDNRVWVAVYYWLEADAELIPFVDHREAQRFIKRVGGIV